MIPTEHCGQNEVLFDSRNEYFKFPTGAVPAGTPIVLSLLLHRGLRLRNVSVYFSLDGHPAEEHPLHFAEDAGEHQKWSGTVVPQAVGLYWYTFRVETENDLRFYGRDGFNRPVCGCGNPAAWQVTVYDGAQTLPEGWAGGMIYQIFPDRFFRAGEQALPPEKQYATLKSPEELPNWKREPNGDLDTTDFFGGNLKGIEGKLDDLCALGVTVLYLNPIFEAHSNHRYDTADYEKIDPLLGSEEDFRSLCNAAHERGIKILLDGVFSHTGEDSRYFNRYGTYPGAGAYQSKESPYYPWFKFKEWPNEYEAWWGIKILPEVDESNPQYREYITGKDGILRRWMRAGADGWRFDVADELPDVFLDEARAAIKEENPQALFLGEVWEDATNKIAYGERRRYLLGKQLDSVMNYVVKEAVLSFVLEGDGKLFAERIGGWLENYPPCAVHCAMNLIGTHDTPRVLTVLSNKDLPTTAEEQVAMILSPEEKALALERLKIADVLLFTLPGIPSVYYGDEAGAEGGQDPLNRKYYPWGREDADLIAHVKALGTLRKQFPVFREGTLKFLQTEGGVTVYRREQKGETSIAVAVNASDEEKTVDLAVPCTDLLTNKFFAQTIVLQPRSAAIFAEQTKNSEN